MTGDEIRTWGNKDGRLRGVMYRAAPDVLIEIAAQLADLNDTLRTMAATRSTGETESQKGSTEKK